VGKWTNGTRSKASKVAILRSRRGGGRGGRGPKSVPKRRGAGRGPPEHKKSPRFPEPFGQGGKRLVELRMGDVYGMFERANLKPGVRGGEEKLGSLVSRCAGKVSQRLNKKKKHVGALRRGIWGGLHQREARAVW